jgi:transposase InsO family protein
VPPSLLKRDFTAERPHRKVVTDITYIPTTEVWRYLAAVPDLYSHRVVAWAMPARMTSDLTKGALGMAVQHWQVAPGLMVAASGIDLLLVRWDWQRRLARRARLCRSFNCSKPPGSPGGLLLIGQRSGGSYGCV